MWECFEGFMVRLAWNMVFWVYASDVFRPFVRLVYWFGCPNSGHEVAIIDFNFIKSNYTDMVQKTKMHIKEEKNETQKGWNKRINCQLKCFHSLKYIIDHADICFFF